LDKIATGLTYFFAMLFALTLRSTFRCYAAYWAGDITPKVNGRLSVNPAVHADLVGTIIFPLVGFMLQWPIIGWSKELPIDERNFRNQTWQPLVVSLSGVFANFVMAFLAVAALILFQKYGQGLIPPESFFYPLVGLVQVFAFMNAILGMFNLLPVPPLDGAVILKTFMDRSMYERFEQTVAPYAMILLLVLALMGGLSWVSKLGVAYVQFCERILSTIF
jgi:Zn-dependent protease